LLANGANDQNTNPKQLHFVDFGSCEIVNGQVQNNRPVNPWGSKDPTKNDERHFYYVKFDKDFNRVIPAASVDLPANIPPPAAPSCPAPSRPDQPRTDVRADVIVWTYNPDLNPSDPRYVIGSWMR
jgi:hypothetical protein